MACSNSDNLYKNKQNPGFTRKLKKNLSKDVTETSVNTHLEDECSSQQIFPNFKLFNKTNQNSCYDHSIKYFGKHLSHDSPSMLQQRNQSNSMKQDSQIFNIENIEILQDIDLIKMEENEFSTKGSQQFPFLINPIYCYNSEENINNTKPTRQVNEQESSNGLFGNLLSFLRNIRGGCIPPLNQRNSDDDTVQNNYGRASPRQLQSKMPGQSSKTENNDGSSRENGVNNNESPQISVERYGCLGKKKLEMLNKQRELEKANKKLNQQPINEKHPIGKLQPEPGKYDKQVEKSQPGPSKGKADEPPSSQTNRAQAQKPDQPANLITQGQQDPTNKGIPTKERLPQPTNDNKNDQKGLESTKKESDDLSKPGQKSSDKPMKEDKKVDKVPQDNEKAKERKPEQGSPAAAGKEMPDNKKDVTTDPNQKGKSSTGVEKLPAVSSVPSSDSSKKNPVESSTSSHSVKSKQDKASEEGTSGVKEDSGDEFGSHLGYDTEVLREKLKQQIKLLREEGLYTDSEFDDMDDEIYETVMAYGTGSNYSKMSISSESSLSLPSLSNVSYGSSSNNMVKDLWTVLRKRSKSELDMNVRPIRKSKERAAYTSGKTTTIGEAHYVDYENKKPACLMLEECISLLNRSFVSLCSEVKCIPQASPIYNLPTNFKVTLRDVEATLLMNFDPERKAMSGDKCFRLHKEPERGRQVSIPINDLLLPLFVYDTDNDPEGILITDQVIRSKLQVCLEVASMYFESMSVKRGRLLVHLAENAPNSTIGFLRQLAEAVVNRRINTKAEINGFLNKLHEMSSADRTILKKDLGDKPELDNFRLLSRLKTKVFSEFYRRVGYWEIDIGQKEVDPKHLFLIRHMPRLYKTGLYPFIDFISEYIANNQIRTLDQLEVALIRFLVCSEGAITKSEFNTFCDFGLKKKC